MVEEKIVQFVMFETILDKEQFISHWEKFTRSDDSDRDVILHQSEKNGLFRYLSKHIHTGGFKFIFERRRPSSKNRQVSIKVVQEGGYSILQLTRRGDCHPYESKIFCFIQNPQADLNRYKEIKIPSNHNVYAAYYENCRFAFILEFFVKNDRAKDLIEALKQNGVEDMAVYKECKMQLA